MILELFLINSHLVVFSAGLVGLAHTTQVVASDIYSCF